MDRLCLGQNNLGVIVAGKKKFDLNWQHGALAVLAIITFAIVGFTFLKPPPSAALPPAVANYTPPPVTLPAAPKLPALPAGSPVLIIGDSYALGTGATTRETGRYAARVAAAFGWAATIDGIGGTGFTWGGTGGDGNKYGARVAAHAANPDMKPQLVILQGGQNDHRAKPDELKTAVANTIAAVKAAWPDASILVVGPTAPQPLAGMLGRIATPINAAAMEAGVFSINPIRENWFTKENSPGFDFDKSHVNDAGHQYMAERIVADIKDFQK